MRGAGGLDRNLKESDKERGRFQSGFNPVGDGDVLPKQHFPHSQSTTPRDKSHPRYEATCCAARAAKAIARGDILGWINASTVASRVHASSKPEGCRLVRLLLFVLLLLPHLRGALEARSQLCHVSHSPAADSSPSRRSSSTALFTLSLLLSNQTDPTSIPFPACTALPVPAAPSNATPSHLAISPKASSHLPLSPSP